MIRFAGDFLYHLGLGEHAIWFELTSSKAETSRHSFTSGRILVQFKIDDCTPRSEPCHPRSVEPRNISDRTELHDAESVNAEHVAQVPHDSDTPAVVGKEVSTLIRSWLHD